MQPSSREPDPNEQSQRSQQDKERQQGPPAWPSGNPFAPYDPEREWAAKERAWKGKMDAVAAAGERVVQVAKQPVEASGVTWGDVVLWALATVGFVTLAPHGFKALADIVKAIREIGGSEK